MAQTHYFPTDRVHFQWDTGNEPVIEVDSGDTVVVETRDVSDNQIGPDSTTETVAGLDWERVYPLAGPIAVRGAEPGDTLAIEILDIHTRGWGWTAILPELGLLTEDFPNAYLLCSLVVDLKISEIVDAGVFVVSAFLPEAIFS